MNTPTAQPELRQLRGPASPGACALIAFLLLTMPASAGEKLAIHRVPDSPFIYEVDRAVLEAEANAWDVGSQPFPADLRAFVNKAKDHLVSTREVSAELIAPVIFVQWEPVREPNKRSWYVVVSFTSFTKDRMHVPAVELTVVMLLDGTIADTTLVRGTLVYPFRNKTPDGAASAPASETSAGILGK